MRILVLGSGAREHALVWRLAHDPAVTELHCAPGNPGISALAQCHEVRAEDVPAVVDLAEVLRADLVVVGPEAPLEVGVVDALQAAGFLAFGPTRDAALLETSKSFGKEVMRAAGVPTAAYGLFLDYTAAEAFIRAHPGRLAVKVDGLAAGKGVVLAQDEAEALAAAREMLVEGKFGQAGRKVLIEEFLDGEEVSVIALCDGRQALLLPTAQDHKAAYDGNRGPNTGGMGAYSPVPFVTHCLVTEIQRTIVDPILQAMAERGTPFRGALFCGLMLTARGPMVLEYNARFGDPEAQVMLALVEGPFAEALAACARGDLSSLRRHRHGVGGGGASLLRWDPARAAVCVNMAAPGYPGSYPKGIPLGGISAAEAEGCGCGSEVVVFHAGTAWGPDGGIVSSGGRVLGVTAVAGGLADAVSLAYRAVDRIGFPGAHYRRDIGRRGLLQGAAGSGR